MHTAQRAGLTMAAPRRRRRHVPPAQALRAAVDRPAQALRAAADRPAQALRAAADRPAQALRAAADRPAQMDCVHTHYTDGVWSGIDAATAS